MEAETEPDSEAETEPEADPAMDLPLLSATEPAAARRPRTCHCPLNLPLLTAADHRPFATHPDL